MLRCILLSSALLLSTYTIAQIDNKIPLEIADLNTWNRIRSVQISADGQYVAYVLSPGEGDPIQVLFDTQREEEQRWVRADGGRFSANGTHFVFMVHPAKDTLKDMRRRKIKKKDLPGDTLAVMDLNTQALNRIAEVKRFVLPTKWSGWLAYHQKTPLPDSLTKSLTKDAYRLVLHQLSSQNEYTLDGVEQMKVAEEASVILAYSSGLDSLQSPGVYRFDGRQPAFIPLRQGKGKYSTLALSVLGDKAAFLANFDTLEPQVIDYDLHTWTLGQDSAYLQVRDGISADWRIQEKTPLTFSHQGDRLFFGTAPQPVLQDTNLLEEEIVNVEVWTTADPRLYTRAENQLKDDQKRGYMAMFDWDSGRMQQIANLDHSNFRLANRGDSKYALVYHEESYLPRMMYLGGPSYRDLYLYDLEAGNTTLVEEELRAVAHWSPEGKYLYWYNLPDTAWQVFDVEARELRNLTTNTLGTFYDEENDRPMDPWFHGIAGWTEGDEAILIYDRYDWWKIDPKAPGQAKRITEGREHKRQFRYVKTDPEERHLPNSALLRFFDEDSRNSGYAQLDLEKETLTIQQEGAFFYGRKVYKARETEAFVYTKETFREFPDLRYTNDLAQPGDLISEANPQQTTYRWGNMELYQWTDPQGRTLSGLLLKPDNFDPDKQYPLIVNFYERSSNGLYRHRPPYPGRSTINYSYYTSRGYVIFNPDVPYRVGYPGESAYDAVMSGTTALINEGFIDRTHIGVQGHSWGGYQIAHLLTKTDLFACAESGAPVVNMFSAYGGIRWGSGLSRQFQYERTQSRIGGTPWEYPIRYLENSPLFFMDKVNTPVLILHNDEDGAVPWYQGIEYFNALRRLGKPAWLLNYNGEPHWPVKPQNRLDFQTRLSQFFDHYLKDKPAPRWMKEGVSPIRKGIDQALELTGEKE